MTTEVVDGEIIVESTDLALPSRETAPTLFGTSDPVKVIEGATRIAQPLAGVVRKQGLASQIQGREYVRVEGWTLLGSMLGVFPVTVWTHKLEDGWEARVEVRTRDGATIGAAEAECLYTEKTWKGREDYALRSMAQTRATSKALRQPLGFVMQLAGFEATPAEEMPAHGEGGGLGFGKYRGQTVAEVFEIDRGYVEWLAGNAKDEPVRAEAQALLSEPAPTSDDDIPF